MSSLMGWMPRLIHKQYAIMLLFLLFGFHAASAMASGSEESHNKIVGEGCDENGDCLSDAQFNCHKICGCDRSGFVAVYYNETSKSCVVSFKHLMIPQINVYGNDEDDEDERAATMAEKISQEADRVFNTILVSVILFISFCAICVVSACLYCCRMTYSDYVLKNDVKALAKKLKRNHKIVKPAKIPTAPAKQSCNVVCVDAGVYVV